MSDKDNPRKNELTIIEADDDYHLMDYQDRAPSEINSLCGKSFEKGEYPTHTFPFEILDYTSICIDCYYQNQLKVDQVSEYLRGNDED